jgi:hypothetical protein
MAVPPLSEHAETGRHSTPREINMEENQEPSFWEICAQPETRTRSIARTRSLYHHYAVILANCSDLDNRRIEVALHMYDKGVYHELAVGTLDFAEPCPAAESVVSLVREV